MKNNKALLLIASLVLLVGLGWLFLANRQDEGLTVEQAEDQAEVVVGDFVDEEQFDELEQELSAKDSSILPGDIDSDNLESDVQGVVDRQDDAAEVRYVFFYGDTCPYCHDVIDWMDETGIESTLDVTRKETYNDQKHSEQMSLAIRNCGLSSSGVPMLYTSDKECIVGSTPIIDYLSGAVGI